MKTLLKSQYLELKNAEKNKLMNVYDSTITISDDEYNCLMQYADGKEIIVIDDSTPINPTPTQQKTNMPIISNIGGGYACIFEISGNGLIKVWDNQNNNISEYNRVEISYPYKRNEEQHITIYATAQEEGKEISNIVTFNYIIPAWTSDVPLPGEITYDDCDFGVDDYGYKIISFEDSTVSIKYCGNKELLTEAIIPETIEYNEKIFNITIIAAGAFDNCINLKNITIPDSVTHICNGAFIGCSNLTNITIPDSITYIGEHAFSACYNLTNITIPNSVTIINDNAFYNCFFNNFINNSNLDEIENNYWGAIIYDYNIDGMLIKNNDEVITGFNYETNTEIKTNVHNSLVLVKYINDNVQTLIIPNNIEYIKTMHLIL